MNQFETLLFALNGRELILKDIFKMPFINTMNNVINNGVVTFKIDSIMQLQNEIQMKQLAYICMEGHEFTFNRLAHLIFDYSSSAKYNLLTLQLKLTQAYLY